MQQADTEKQEISVAYIKSLFERKQNATKESDETKQKRLELLNEFLSDQSMERLSALLARQFTEKEQLLKALLQKYMDARLAEEAGIKASYLCDFDKLDQIKDRLEPNDFKD